MRKILAASFLGSMLLTGFEYILIVLDCGPFWMQAEIFIKTLFVHFIFFFVLLFILFIIVQLIKPLKRYLSKKQRLFVHSTGFCWLIGGFYIGFQLFKFLPIPIGRNRLLYLFLIIAFISVTELILMYILRNVKSYSAVTSYISVFIIIFATSTYLISSVYYSKMVADRNSIYDGKISDLCILILDTTRGDFISSNSFPEENTIHIDKLASAGLSCKEAYSAATWTPPGHISIFTGKYPSQHGNAGKEHMPEELISITEILCQHGYFCVGFNNNTLAGRSINLTQGFDLEYTVWRERKIYPLWIAISGRYLHNDYGASATLEASLEMFNWIKKRDGHLFLYINLNEPHLPYLIHEPYFSSIVDQSILENITNLQELIELCNSSFNAPFESSIFENFNEESYTFIENAYASEIAYIDKEIGEFTSRLEYLNYFDETLLIITSDHGEALGEHDSWGHPSLVPFLMNSTLRIPLIMRYPKVIVPQTNAQYVSNIDIFPTVLNIMGYEECIPNDVQGFNILDIDQNQNRPIMSEWIRDDDWGYCIFDGAFKAIVNRSQELDVLNVEDTLLFRIDIDPNELNNLYPVFPDIGDSLILKALNWRESIYVEPSNDLEVSREAIQAMRALGYIN